MKKVQIKNYTSGVSASVSLAKIEDCLVSAGAQYVTKDYSGDTQVTIYVCDHTIIKS